MTDTIMVAEIINHAKPRETRYIDLSATFAEVAMDPLDFVRKLDLPAGTTAVAFYERDKSKTPPGDMVRSIRGVIFFARDFVTKEQAIAGAHAGDTVMKSLKERFEKAERGCGRSCPSCHCRDERVFIRLTPTQYGQVQPRSRVLDPDTKQQIWPKPAA